MGALPQLPLHRSKSRSHDYNCKALCNPTQSLELLPSTSALDPTPDPLSCFTPAMPASCRSGHTPGTLQPQVLCTCSSLCLECSPTISTLLKLLAPSGLYSKVSCFVRPTLWIFNTKILSWLYLFPFVLIALYMGELLEDKDHFVLLTAVSPMPRTVSATHELSDT